MSSRAQTSALPSMRTKVVPEVIENLRSCLNSGAIRGHRRCWPVIAPGMYSEENDALCYFWKNIYSAVRAWGLGFGVWGLGFGRKFFSKGDPEWKILHLLNKRRTPSPTQRRPKAQVLSECSEPGASVAAIVLSHSRNTNLVHRRYRLAARGSEAQNAPAAPFLAPPIPPFHPVSTTPHRYSHRAARRCDGATVRRWSV